MQYIKFKQGHHNSFQRLLLYPHGSISFFLSLLLKSDKAIQQELDHAKAQCLDAQRAEKLLKVDFHQLEKRVSC